jgi:protein O-mannosyl-transferase
MWSETLTPGRIRLAVCVFLTAIIWAVFGQTGWFQFVNYDDLNYVVQEPHVAAGLTWQHAGWAFTHVHSGNWHPLTTISHMLDGSIFGVRPGPQHLVNVLLHSISAVLLFLALEKLTGGPSRTGSIWPSAFVAAVFAIHPLRVESVAWISERKDVLSGVLFMMTLLAYASYARRRTVIRYASTAIFLAAGLMSKPTVVMTPFVLLLLDYWPLQRFNLSGPRTDEATDERGRTESLGKLLLEKIPFFLLSLGLAVMTILAQKFAIGSTSQLPLKWRLSNAVLSYFEYVRLTFWPHDLIPFYIHPEGRLELWRLALSAATIVLITAVAWIWRSRRKYLLIGWAWYLIMLIPAIGLMQVGLQAKADRYTYLPQIGLLIMIGWLVRDLLASWRKRKILFPAAAAISLGTLSVLSFWQTSRWRDSESLWTYTLGITPESDMAHTGLAALLYDRAQLDEAIQHYRVALSHRPENGVAQSGIARALADQHKGAEAMAHWKKAVEIEPDNIQASNEVALSYVRAGDWAAGIRQWENTLRFDPDNFDACNNLSWALSTVNDPGLRNPGRALELARRAIELAQDKSPAVYRTLAVAYGENHLFAEGIAIAEEGLRLSERLGTKAVTSDLERCIAAFQNGKTWRERPR